MKSQGIKVGSISFKISSMLHKQIEIYDVKFANLDVTAETRLRICAIETILHCASQF